ncbi:MAG: caspase family protein [Coleofasciculus sp. B1-GNL1-01]|uniref:caspase family protein n=1 Tax=Coleofasciculus sp. B1-GNL1-01 TaxID=3068484 RepID=UPI0032F2E13E
MYHLSRRHFLQFAGSTLATLGLSQWDIIQKSHRYAKVLAQDTPRKLALLVGINQYPNSDRFGNLAGCVTDVDLQEYLLIHRFGFHPHDIISLTSDETPDKQPTRQIILTAFEEHLIKQAKPGDVVVFHFSGHGSRLYDPNSLQNCPNQIVNDELNSTLVPADDGQNGIALDIMGRSLFLLMSALNTENVTAVLDSCYSGGGTRGNFRVRSVSGKEFQPSPEEIAYQKRWMEMLQLSPEKVTNRRCRGVAKGIVVASAQRDQEALDAYLGGFYAGAFTYLMTQYLWQQTDTVGNAIAKIAHNIKSLSRQVPLADGDRNRPIYFFNRQVPPADAVITQVNGDEAMLWLGGVGRESLEAFQPGATFAMANDGGQNSGKVELVSRDGLWGEAKLVETDGVTSLQPGMLLQEYSRVIPANLTLRLGVDPSLSGEINLLQNAIAALPRTEIIPAQPGNVPYPGGVQSILSRVSVDSYRELQRDGVANLPAVGSIGLFTEAFVPVPRSFGEVGETVTDAIERLEPKLKSFLATYIIKKTLNAGASQLNVEVSMHLVEKPERVLARTTTGREQASQESVYPNRLPVQKLFQFRVTNRESEPLYLTTLLIDSTGGLVVVFPYLYPTSKEGMRLDPGRTLTIGDPKQLRLQARESGTAEALVIASRTPMERAVKTLVSLAQELNRSEGALALREPVEVVGDLLADLSEERSIAAVRARRISTAEIATLSITFEVS